MPDTQVANDVYERYGLKWADFPRSVVPSAHSDDAELFCARQSLAVYGVYPNLPHDFVRDYVPSRIAAAVAARTFDLNRMIEGGADLAGTSFESERGYRTVVTDQAGALMVWKENRLIVAVRGTANWQDWIHNFTGTIIPVPTIAADDEKFAFHKGFCGLAANLQPSVRDMVGAFAEARGDDIEITFCGHSLGGALALHLAAIFLEDSCHFFRRPPRHYYGEWPVVATYTFGAPRLGTGEIWRAIARPHYRLIVRSDPVPRTPPRCEEDFQAAYLERPEKPAVQPASTFGKIRMALSSRMPASPFSGEAHLIETYIDAIERKIKAKTGGNPSS